MESIFSKTLGPSKEVKNNPILLKFYKNVDWMDKYLGIYFYFLKIFVFGTLGQNF